MNKVSFEILAEELLDNTPYAIYVYITFLQEVNGQWLQM